MLSRRAFLVGAVGVVGGGAAAAAGAQTPLGRKALHAAGLVDSPDRAIPAVDVPVEHGQLPGGRRYALAHTGPSPRLGLVCLHGRNNDERFAFDILGVHRFAAAAGRNVVVASVDGGAASYWHPRRTGGDPMAAVLNELVPLVDQRTNGAPRALIGWSMGGYGALLAAERHPDTFAAVVAASPAVFRSFADTPAGAFDDEADFARHRLSGAAAPRLRIDCGADDPFAHSSDDLRRRYRAQGRTTPGFHDAAYWRSVLPAQLAFLVG